MTRELGRPAATISQALKWNSNQDGSYRPGSAEGRYFYRRPQDCILDQNPDPDPAAFIRERRQDGWTAEQISGGLRAAKELVACVEPPASPLPTGLKSMTDPQKPTDANTSVTGKVM
ncbi:MAG: hypothetical protein JKY17_04505 [Magnetovibrio sp.]|nr:hypothetical protein [Magnetovibrio sp.]